jgi:hypothetical protein
MPGGSFSTRQSRYSKYWSVGLVGDKMNEVVEADEKEIGKGH